MSDLRSISGRVCAPSPVAITLHKFTGSLPQLESLQRNCLNKNRESYNYVVDGCRSKAFVPVGDTAYAIPFPVCPVVVPPACPPIPPLCSNGTNALTGLSTTVNPNCKVISVGYAVGLNSLGICGAEFDCDNANIKCIAKFLKNLATENGITLSASTLIPFGFDEDFPLCDLLDCIANVIPDVVPPNPEIALLCGVLSQFPTGTPTTVFGKDASGKCVQGIVTGGGVTTVTTNLNKAIPQFEISVNGTLSSTLPLVELREAVTNNLLGYIFQP